MEDFDLIGGRTGGQAKTRSEGIRADEGGERAGGEITQANVGCGFGQWGVDVEVGGFGEGVEGVEGDGRVGKDGTRERGVRLEGCGGNGGFGLDDEDECAGCAVGSGGVYGVGTGIQEGGEGDDQLTFGVGLGGDDRALLKDGKDGLGGFADGLKGDGARFGKGVAVGEGITGLGDGAESWLSGGEGGGIGLGGNGAGDEGEEQCDEQDRPTHFLRHSIFLCLHGYQFVFSL